jgi:hypothetical protein
VEHSSGVASVGVCYSQSQSAAVCLHGVTHLSTPVMPELVHGLDLSGTVPYVTQQLARLRDSSNA